MSLAIHVQGHRNVHRKVREQVKRDWDCPSCGAHNRYYWVKCPACSHPRPH